MKYVFSWILGLVLISACGGMKPKTYEVKSPEGLTRIGFSLDAKGRPYYMAWFKDQLVTDTSLLGFELNEAAPLQKDFEVLTSTESSFDETWEQPWGEQQFIRNHYKELKVSLQEKQALKRKMDIVFRVYDDGIGFRYEFPEQENLKHIEILEELTEFNLAGDYTSWWIPALEREQYEYLFQRTPSSKIGLAHTPVTFSTEKEIYLSIHEAALKNYSSMMLDGKEGQRLKCSLVPYSKTEKSKAFLSTPGTTPWRTIQLADKPGDLITSYLILNLNEPNQLGDVSWVKPCKYIGIWWEMHIGAGTWSSGELHSANTANTKKYIDFAAENGFDGVLVEGWNTGWDGDWVKHGGDFNFTQTAPDFDLAALSAYAKSKGVYIIGHHETGGNIDNYERQMQDAYQQMEMYGIKAVKTGYVEHGSILSNGKYHHGQAYIDHFRKVIQLAAQHKIAVVAHEPIKDTGERRTFPNMVSREGARGQEYNAWSADGGNPPDHETILPFTRCLSGPMDFTPGAFDITIPGKPDNQVNTTLAKQLALYVTIYSPVQMACDLPAHYEKYPDAFSFIKEVGVDWETTKVLDGEIGEFVTIARKEKGSGDWFVGAITNEQPRSLDMKLDFLDVGQSYTAKIYRDGDDADYKTNPESYVIETVNVTSHSTIKAKLAPGGGVAISIFKARS
ncbi:MAG TPA: glycoside hydrolase family 97 protein [Saprospiraceae bacterium]